MKQLKREQVYVTVSRAKTWNDLTTIALITFERGKHRRRAGPTGDGSWRPCFTVKAFPPQKIENKYIVTIMMNKMLQTRQNTDQHI